jgi:hypothetical protein
VLQPEPSEQTKTQAAKTMVATARKVLPPDEVEAIDRTDDPEANAPSRMRSEDSKRETTHTTNYSRRCRQLAAPTSNGSPRQTV